MKTDHDNIIDIVDSDHDDHRPVERPVISIEKESAHGSPKRASKLRGRSLYRAAIVGCLVIITLLAAAVWHYRYELMSPGVPVSFSDREMLDKMDAAFVPSAKGTIHTSDSVLGVAMDFFALDGLKASLEPAIPNLSDSTLVLFMRSADYNPDKKVIGSIVVDGNKNLDKEIKSRPAYLAITKEGKPFVGISLTDRVMNRIADTGGSFFRQYLLLSAGELPEKFHLHGKIERAAIGRTADDKLFYILTRHPETMYDFADALREYGFMDAIYLTGGNSYSFHRDPDGTAHSGAKIMAKIEKYTDSNPPAPLLVFRNK